MPIYEYRCDKGHTFEVTQRMTDDPVVACQTCEAPVQRVFHPIAVHFKGKGFYNTDYGTRQRQRENAAAGEGSSSDSSSPSESKSDSSGSTDSSSGSTDGSSKPAEKKPAAPAAKSSAEK